MRIRSTCRRAPHARSGCWAAAAATVTVTPAEEPLEVADANEDEAADACYRRATWSATYAPRRPIGRGGPSVLSRTVCSSSSAFSSAPSSTT